MCELCEKLTEEKRRRDKAIEVASRLAGKDLSRQTGRTTRIVDAAIQELFEKGEVTIVDHHPSGSDHALRLLQNRLAREHAGVIVNHVGNHTVKLKYFNI